MSNSETPTGANGNKKELKVTRTNEADILLDEYFKKLRNEGYDKININALVFDVPEVNIKSKAGDEEETRNNFGDIINVLESGKVSIELKGFLEAVVSKTKSAPKSKVKNKINKIKEENRARKENEQENSDKDKEGR